MKLGKICFVSDVIQIDVFCVVVIYKKLGLNNSPV